MALYRKIQTALELDEVCWSAGRALGSSRTGHREQVLTDCMKVRLFLTGSSSEMQNQVKLLLPFLLLINNLIKLINNHIIFLID